MAWGVTLIGILGSLYFSEVLNFVPCLLCWYQRIALYPLLVTLTVGILIKDKNLHLYVLPLSIAGLSIATYHSLLYYHLIPEKLGPCVEGISCLTKYIDWFGFISIPLLSFITFLIITLIMIINRRQNNE